MARSRADIGVLERYRPLLDDWPAFAAALDRPLPPCVWANTLRASPAYVEGLLRDGGYGPRPIPWVPGAFRLEHADGLGREWWYLAGLCHGQEEVSMLPARLLEPRPGDRVLDLCAAPGGKTAQMAVALDNRGTVVANDVTAGRMKPLRANIERLGLVNISTTLGDGANLPGAAGPFDRILVDAPCSGEGTWRKNTYGAGDLGREVSRDRAGLQKALLRKATQLCRQGGRVVYSTCTFAPEENEEVVDAILREQGPERFRLVPAAMPGLTTTPGVTEWEGRALLPELAGCVRVWPHHNDTGGFFVAVLERLVESSQDETAPFEPAWADATEWVPYFQERFGVPEAFWEPYRAYRQSTRGLHLVDREHAAPARPGPDTSGLFFFRTALRPPKPTTAAAMLVAPHADRNCIDLEHDQLDTYLRGETFALNTDQRAVCSGPGRVLVRYRGFGMGAGYYLAEEGLLESHFPRRHAGREG